MKPASQVGRHHVAEQVLVHWLQDGVGDVVEAVRLELGQETAFFQDASFVQKKLDQIFDVNAGATRPSSATIAWLARRLAVLANDGPPGKMRRDRLEGEIFREMLAVVRTLGVSLDECGLPHLSYGETGNEPVQERADELSAAIEGNGTQAHPYAVPRGKVPISEFGASNYTTAAFPTLFPFGRGDFSEPRAVALSWTQYSQHLMNYHDGRFARHDRFRYFMLNTHERQRAHEQAGLCIKEHKLKLSVGDVRQMSRKEKELIAQRVERYGATLRNTPGFFRLRRNELEAMIEQLGDPHVFATNSHADTYCPELQRFIKAWAQEDFAKATPDGRPAGCSAGFDLDDPGLLSEKEKSRRRIRNLKTYPHLVALFFHLKMELYVEHICRGIMKADAHWARYEWQSRGSTHVHYFLWLSDAPEITSVLDGWTRAEAQRILGFGDNESELALSEEQLDQLVESLNCRANEVSKINEKCDARAGLAAALAAEKAEDNPRLLSIATEVAGVPPDDSGAHEQKARQDARDAITLAHAANYWRERCSRWSHGWDKVRDRPDQATVGFGAHACSKDVAYVCPSTCSVDAASTRTQDVANVCSLDETAADGTASKCMGCEVPMAVAADLNAVRNASCRHTNCNDYCLRINSKTGERYCRFHFPQQAREPNAVPYFYCERVKTGIRWKLYLPMNDSKMGKANLWQLASQRANVDFSPLIDHECAVEYCTKYAQRCSRMPSAPFSLLPRTTQRFRLPVARRRRLPSAGTRQRRRRPARYAQRCWRPRCSVPRSERTWVKRTPPCASSHRISAIKWAGETGRHRR